MKNQFSALTGKAAIRIVALAGLSLLASGCVYDSEIGLGYASDGYASAYDCDPYSQFDSYYECDYRYGFSNIGYGGGWYSDYYYPGYGYFIFDSYGSRFRMQDNYLRYWGQRRYDYYRSNNRRGQYGGTGSYGNHDGNYGNNGNNGRGRYGHDGRRDDRHDNRHEGERDGRYDGRRDNRHDGDHGDNARFGRNNGGGNGDYRGNRSGLNEGRFGRRGEPGDRSERQPEQNNAVQPGSNNTPPPAIDRGRRGGRSFIPPQSFEQPRSFEQPVQTAEPVREVQPVPQNIGRGDGGTEGRGFGRRGGFEAPPAAEPAIRQVPQAEPVIFQPPPAVRIEPPAARIEPRQRPENPRGERYEAAPDIE